MLTIVVVLYQAFILTSAVVINLKAEAYLGYQDKIEMYGAISITTASSVLRCVKKCEDSDGCLTFFYNSNTHCCVLHSKNFSKEPNLVEYGWKYYRVITRCPSPYLYDKERDYCYILKNTTSIDLDQIHASCSLESAKLAAVESQEKYDYFLQIVGNRPDLSVRVPIRGSRISANQWELDGSPLTFLKWYPGQPGSNMNDSCLALKTNNFFLI